jgi:hypothetical protein
MPDANGTITLADLLDGGDMNKLTAALQKAKLGSALSAPFKETLVVGTGGGFAANTVVLARPAALIEGVYDETDNKSLFIIPTGEAPVDQVSCAISADRKTLTLHSGGDGNTVTVTYFASATDPTVAAGF